MTYYSSNTASKGRSAQGSRKSKVPENLHIPRKKLLSRLLAYPTLSSHPMSIIFQPPWAERLTPSLLLTCHFLAEK